MRAIRGGSEEQLPVVGREFAWVENCRAGPNIFDKHCSRRCSIRLPQLNALLTGDGDKEQSVSYDRETVGLESAPGEMSFTSTVPAAVPSLFQSSVPASNVDCGKIECPVETGQIFRRGAPGPGRMSRTRKVPAAVPSDSPEFAPRSESMPWK